MRNAPSHSTAGIHVGRASLQIVVVDAEVAQPHARDHRALQLARERNRVRAKVVRARAVRGERIDAVRQRVQVNRHQRIRVRLARHHRAIAQRNGIGGRARHEHVRAALLEHLLHDQPHRERRHRLVQTRGPGRTNGRMSRIDGDRESLERRAVSMCGGRRTRSTNAPFCQNAR